MNEQLNDVYKCYEYQPDEQQRTLRGEEVSWEMQSEGGTGLPSLKDNGSSCFFIPEYLYAGGGKEASNFSIVCKCNSLYTFKYLKTYII